MVVARNVDHDPTSRHGNVVVIAVPTSQVEIQTPYRKVGNGPWPRLRCTSTRGCPPIIWWPGPAPGWRRSRGAWPTNACRSPDRSPPGHNESRITLARMMKRRQFGHTLYEHQALRMRIADLQARVDLLRYALAGAAAQGGKLDLRAAAAFKVTAARLGEEVASECMHIFGGSGYLVDETPLGKWWRGHEAGPRRWRH